MSTLIFEDQTPFVDRGIKRGDCYREIKTGKVFGFWSEENGEVVLVRHNGEYFISVEKFDSLFKPLTPPNQLQDE
jgi:hypothetical protein